MNRQLQNRLSPETSRVVYDWIRAAILDGRINPWLDSIDEMMDTFRQENPAPAGKKHPTINGESITFTNLRNRICVLALCAKDIETIRPVLTNTHPRIQSCEYTGQPFLRRI
jgi:hypothetical protein